VSYQEELTFSLGFSFLSPAPHILSMDLDISTRPASSQILPILCCVGEGESLRGNLKAPLEINDMKWDDNIILYFISIGIK
jgi:hypothetical protein